MNVTIVICFIFYISSGRVFRPPQTTLPSNT